MLRSSTKSTREYHRPSDKAVPFSIGLSAGLWGAQPVAAPLELRSSTSQVGRFEKIEFEIHGLGDYERPFDPTVIDARLEFTDAMGRQSTVPAFHIQPYERRRVQGRDWFHPVGSPLGEFLERTDPYGHLRTTSTWGPSPKDCRHPELDLADTHFYLRPADRNRLEDEVEAIQDRVRWLREQAPNKPAFLAEFGLWWERLDERDVYPLYRPVSAFVADVPWTGGELQPVTPGAIDPRLRVVGCRRRIAPGSGSFIARPPGNTSSRSSTLHPNSPTRRWRSAVSPSATTASNGGTRAPARS